MVCIALFGQLLQIERIRAQITSRDTIILRNTLISSFMRIEHKPLRVGGALGYSSSTLSAMELPASLRAGCDLFTGGKGRSYSLDVRADIPLWGDESEWTFAPRIGYQILKGKLTYDNVVPVAGQDTLPPQFVGQEFALEPTLGGVTLSSAFAVEPVRRLRIEFVPTLLIAMAARYEKFWRAKDPGVNINGEREILLASDRLPERYVFTGAAGVSVGYELPLSRSLFAEPHLQAQIILPGHSPYLQHWSIGGGIAIRYDQTVRETVVPIMEKRTIAERVTVYDTSLQTVVDPPPALQASIEAVAVSREGAESQVVTLSVEEVKARNSIPVLNYIFFDSASATIPSRYVRYKSAEQASREFRGTTERTDTKPLELYRETLNILGERLQQYPNAAVTLTGSTSNSGAEEGNLALARERADEVKRYLTSIWKIAPARIRTEATVLPRIPSPTALSMGREENRRVEFVVNDVRASDPITVTNVERLATPDRIRLKPSIVADTGIMSIRAWIEGGGRELAAFESGNRGFAATRVWSPTEEDLAGLLDSLNLRIRVVDSAGNVAIGSGSIGLQISRLSKDKPETLERFSLILFGFDESRTEPRNARVLEQVAKLMASTNAKRVTIVGFTDEMGDAQHNLELSRKRANEVKRELERLVQQLKLGGPYQILTEGRGSTERLYDNTLPEGRFFSRTVTITLEHARR